MNTATKIALYIIFGISTLVFGKYFFRDYQRSNIAAERTLVLDDPMDVELPNYGMTETADPQIEEPPSTPEEPAATEATEPLTTGATMVEPDPTTPNATPPVESTTTTLDDSSLPEPRVGFYGGGFCISVLFLGLLAAYDISQSAGRGAVNALFNDDGVGVMDDEYETAEEEWQKGDYLEAIRLMRDYLAKNPKQIHAALRIAEIYEKDLNNPLAAALEYEEILQQKLPRERWGWAAIHLSNLYSGPLEKPDEAIALLRRLESEYGETQAADKARRRLAMVDGTALPDEE